MVGYIVDLRNHLPWRWEKGQHTCHNDVDLGDDRADIESSLHPLKISYPRSLSHIFIFMWKWLIWVCYTHIPDTRTHILTYTLYIYKHTILHSKTHKTEIEKHIPTGTHIVTPTYLQTHMWFACTDSITHTPVHIHVQTNAEICTCMSTHP